MTLQVLQSKVDSSINHVYEDDSEFRLVTRGDSSTIYLSSHTGCALGCRMCWLTQQGQTRMIPLEAEDVIDRGRTLYYETKTPFVNFAFMSRGDPLASKKVDSWLVKGLFNLTVFSRSDSSTPKHTKVSLSSIFPKTHVGEDISDFLFSRFSRGPAPIIYYSLYSMDSEVRERWLPNAQDPEIVVRGLAEWQKHTFTEIVIHYPLIKDVNDGYGTVWSMHNLLKGAGLRYRVNLIHYNPPSGGDFGEEAEAVTYADRLADWIGFVGPENAKIQPRVGPDVYASCGMFTPGEAP